MQRARGRVIERDGVCVCVCLSEGVNENVGEREKENMRQLIRPRV